MASSEGLSQIRSDEGEKLKGHLVDGKLHIGIGFNLTREDAEEMLILSGVKSTDILKVMKVNGQPITEEQSQALFDISVQQAQKDARSLVTGFEKMPQSIKDVLTNMSFQLGKTGLAKFDKTIDAAEVGDWSGMRTAMLDSEWARKDTPSRAKRLATQVSKVKQKPSEKVTAIGKKQSAQEMHIAQLKDSRVKEIADLMNRDSLVNQMADVLEKQQETKQEAQIDGNGS